MLMESGEGNTLDFKCVCLSRDSVTKSEDGKPKLGRTTSGCETGKRKEAVERYKKRRG